MKQKSEEKKKDKGNVCGIIGICTGWVFPLSGIVLGIIALGRKEDNIDIGVASLVMGFLWIAFWYLLLW